MLCLQQCKTQCRCRPSRSLPWLPRAHLDLEYDRYLIRVAEENTTAKIIGPQALHLPTRESWLNFGLPESFAPLPFLPEAKNPPAEVWIPNLQIIKIILGEGRLNRQIPEPRPLNFRAGSRNALFFV